MKELNDDEILVQKYELLLYENKSIYFEVEEFERIAYYYIAVGEYDKALIVVGKAQLCYPENNEVDFIRVKILIAYEELSEAMKMLDDLERREPEWSSINILRGKAYLMMNDLQSALPEFQKASKKEPEETEDIILSIADILTDSGYYDIAADFLMQIEKPSAETLFQIASSFDRRGEYIKAEEYYEKSLDEDPFNQRTWESFGLFYDRQDKFEEALQAFDFALTVNDKAESTLLAKANTLMQLDRYNEAEKILEDLDKEYPENIYTICSLADCYERRMELDKAMSYYSKAAEIDDLFSDAYWGISNVLIKQNNYEMAIVSIDKALDIEPDNADYWFTRGEILLQINSHAEALEAFRKAEEFYPEPETTTVIAKLLALDSIEAAIDELENAIKQYPNEAQLWCCLAVFCSKHGDKEKSEMAVDKALEIDSDCSSKLVDWCPEASLDNAIKDIFERKAK